MNRSRNDIARDQCPTEPGFYWAKSEDRYCWWDVLVEILGQPPYLYWKAIHFPEIAVKEGYGHPTGYIFGPTVERDDNLAKHTTLYGYEK